MEIVSAQKIISGDFDGEKVLWNLGQFTGASPMERRDKQRLKDYKTQLMELRAGATKQVMVAGNETDGRHWFTNSFCPARPVAEDLQTWMRKRRRVGLISVGDNEYREGTIRTSELLNVGATELQSRLVETELAHQEKPNDGGAYYWLDKFWNSFDYRTLGPTIPGAESGFNDIAHGLGTAATELHSTSLGLVHFALGRDDVNWSEEMLTQTVRDRMLFPLASLSLAQLASLNEFAPVLGLRDVRSFCSNIYREDMYHLAHNNRVSLDMRHAKRRRAFPGFDYHGLRVGCPITAKASDEGNLVLDGTWKVLEPLVKDAVRVELNSSGLLDRTTKQPFEWWPRF